MRHPDYPALGRLVCWFRGHHNPTWVRWADLRTRLTCARCGTGLGVRLTAAPGLPPPVVVSQRRVGR